ncbi:MAG: hypothetical protein CO163_01680 [Rhodobacterales bacterium CG_4_9_14_3_um_filter_71_31]|nr:MAG: hypothetical protein CO163_01680 [Rhodobacterales bacterium CG_4_9_14_3_um_filter_71_31]
MKSSTKTLRIKEKSSDRGGGLPVTSGGGQAYSSSGWGSLMPLEAKETAMRRMMRETMMSVTSQK